MRPFYLLWACLVLVSATALGQCPSATITRPASVCVGQPVNIGTSASGNLFWDFSPGEAASTPTVNTFSSFPNPVGRLFNSQAVQVDTGLVVLAIDFGNNQFRRIDLGRNGNNRPVVTNIVPQASTFTTARGLKLVRDGSNWVAFVVINNSSISRFVFDAGLRTIISQGVIAGLPTLTFPVDIDVVKEQGVWYVATVNRGPANNLSLISFGSSLQGPVASTSTVPLSNLGTDPVGVRLVYDCSDWFALISGESMGTLRYRLGNRLATATATLVPFTAASFNPLEHVILQDRGNWYVFQFNNTGVVRRLNFGRNLSNPTPEVVTVGTYSDLSTVRGVSAARDANNRLFIFATTDNPRLVRLDLGLGNTVATQTHVASQANVSLTYTQPGRQYFTLQVLDTSTTRQVQVLDSIDVLPIPVLNLVADRQCPNQPLNFTLQTSDSISNVQISLGDGNIASTRRFTYTYATAGDYAITVQGTALNGCPIFYTQSLRIYPTPATLPTSQFSIPSTACVGERVAVTDQSTWADGTIRRWFYQFGDGQTSTNRNPSIVYNQPGTYQVTLVASDSSGCGNTYAQSITIIGSPQPRFGFANLCFGQAVQFSDSTRFVNAGSAASYAWQFGNGATSNLPSPSYTYPSAGEYTVSLTVTNFSGCAATVQRTIRVYEQPVISISQPGLGFTNSPVALNATVTAPFQTLTTIRWRFNDPAAGADSVANTLAATHVYTQPGVYTATLTVVTDQGCAATASVVVRVQLPCPQADFSVSPPTVAVNTPVTITSTTVGAASYRWDLCAGDLMETPIGKTLSLGAVGASIPSAVQDIDGQWYVFVPIGNSITRLSYGTSLKNAPLQLSLGSPGGYPAAFQAFSFYREDNVWYALATLIPNGNNNGLLVRLTFGNTLNSIPTAVTVSNNPALARPTAIQVVTQRDSVFAFIANSFNTLSNNNLVRVAFGTSITNTPTIAALANSAQLQNSGGMSGVSFIRECNQWIGIATSANGQVYRLRFGTTLNSNAYIGENITLEANVGLTSGALNGVNTVRLTRENGIIHMLLTTGPGQIIMYQFANGLTQAPTRVRSFGNLGLLNNLPGSSLARDGSEWNLFTADANTNSTGRPLFKLEFPNNCATSPSLVVTSSATPPSPQYSLPGTYYISLDAFDTLGLVNSDRDSVIITGNGTGLPSACLEGVLNVPQERCANAQINPFVSITRGGPGVSAVYDACAGDLTQAPGISSAAQVNIPAGNITGFTVVPVGTGFISLGVNNSTGALHRWANLTGDITATPTNVADFAGLFNTPADIRVARMPDGEYIGLVTQLTTNTLALVRFGSSLQNTPSVSTLFAAGSLSRPYGLELFQENGRFYAVVVNQLPSGLTVLDFGNNLNNAPSVRNYPMLTAAGPSRVAMVKDCGVWTGLTVDPGSQGIVHFAFLQGMNEAPTITRVRQALLTGINTPTSIVIGRDAGEFQAFISSNDQNAFWRLPLGRSASDTIFRPLVSLGGFNIVSSQGVSQLVKTRNSQFTLLLITNAGARALHRLVFPNNCDASRPTQDTLSPVAYTYSQPGTRIVTYTVTTAEGVVTTFTDTIQITTPVQPTFNYTNDRCVGTAVTFINRTTANVPISSYEWQFGDGVPGVVQSNAVSPTYTYNAPGRYTVTLLARDLSGCQDLTTRQIVIAAKPRPVFTISASCSFDSATVINQTQLAGDTAAGYDFEIRKRGGSTLATYTGFAPKIYIPDTGTFEIRLRVRTTAGCDTTSPWQTLNILSQGSAVNFDVAPGGLCFGDTTRFIDLTPPGLQLISRDWDFGNGQTYSGTDPKVIYGIKGTYIVKYTVQNISGCTSTFSRVIDLQDKPTGQINTGNLPCINNPTAFEVQGLAGGGTVLSYQWDFGDTTTATGPFPSKVYTRPGTYNVTVRLTSTSGCVNTITSPVTVNPSPRADFDWVGSCANTGIEFTSTSSALGIGGGITNYFWDFGNGQTSTLAKPTGISFATPGVYRVTLTTTAGDCPNTRAKDITILPQPQVRVGRQDGCVGTPYLFIDSSTVGGLVDPASVRTWLINGQTYTGPTAEVLLAESSIPYVVQLTVTSSGGCTAQAQQVLTVGNSPVADFRFRDSVFTVQPYRLRVENRSVYAVRYLWDFGDGTTSTSFAPDHIYAEAGIYTVRLTAIGSGRCSTVTERVLSIVPNARYDLAVNRLNLAANGAFQAINVELVNRGNVDIRTADLLLDINGQTSVVERWTGLLLPGTTLNYVMRTQLVPGSADPADGICLTARLVARTDADSTNNRYCLATGPNFRITQLSPNPVYNGRVKISYNIPEAGNLQLRVIDAIGRQATSLRNERVEAGFYEMQADLKALPPGLYYVTAVLNNQVISRKLVVQ